MASSAGIKERVLQIPAIHALASRDFRLLWIGAFVSFTGSQIQNVAQAFLAYQLTGSSTKLAMVTFAFMAPMSVLPPLAGVVADFVDRKRLLVVAMFLSAIGPAFLAFANHRNLLEYWHFVAVAAAGGLIHTFEVPVRQSVVRSVVRPEDLAGAIPVQAMTFNLARVVGPAAGALVFRALGPTACFMTNAVSYSALAIAALTIRADLRPPKLERQPILDVVLEGMRYTLRRPNLRLLFFMECATSVLGTFYVSQMAALTGKVWRLGVAELGIAYSCVGLGAVSGLVFLASVSGRGWQGRLTPFAMLAVALSVFTLSYTTSEVYGYPCLCVLGAGVIIQFNTTNTLFQLLAPPRLRGRVLSMHIWAISGVAPIGVLLFGWLADVSSLQWAMRLAGAALLLAWSLAWQRRGYLLSA